MLHETLVGNPISPVDIENVLGEVLEDIEKRLEDISISKSGINYKAEVKLESNNLYIVITNNGEESKFSAQAVLDSYDYYFDESWRQPYIVYWENPDLVFTGLTGRIKLASLILLGVSHPTFHIRLYRMLTTGILESKQSNIGYIPGVKGIIATEYKFNVKISNSPNPNNKILEINIKIDLKGNLESSQTIKPL
jgi:hypothetical protein